MGQRVRDGRRTYGVVVEGGRVSCAVSDPARAASCATMGSRTEPDQSPAERDVAPYVTRGCQDTARPAVVPGRAGRRSSARPSWSCRCELVVSAARPDSLVDAQ